MGTLKESHAEHATLRKPNLLSQDTTSQGRGTRGINASTLLPFSEPHPKPTNVTIWVILPGQRRVASRFEGETAR